MENKKIKETRNTAVTAIVLIVVAIVMVVTYIVALSKFGKTDNEDVSSEQETVTSTENVSVHVSAPIHQYKYYEQLKMGKCAYTNEKVLLGNLAVITALDNLPGINEKDLLNLAIEREHDSYVLKDWQIVAREETIDNMDKFLNAFSEAFPDNDLAVWNGYLSEENLKEGSASMDLATGYSLELAIYSANGSSQSFSDPEYSFLPDQAANYGIIQRYPKGKESYTGIEGNSTIYRYIGIAHSGYMKHYNYSLEEYVAKIKEEGVLEFSGYAKGDENSKYVVYYTKMSDRTNTTYVPIPTGGQYEYTVSGDGTSGFIVTVKIA